jgi:hypothetical protein
MLLFCFYLYFLLMQDHQDLSSNFLHELLFIGLKPFQGFVQTHYRDEGSLEMVKFEDTADDGERITEGMDEESNKKINHEVQYVRTFAKKADRLFLHNQTEYFIESIFVQQTEHSISPISAELFFKAI